MRMSGGTRYFPGAHSMQCEPEVKDPGSHRRLHFTFRAEENCPIGQNRHPAPGRTSEVTSEENFPGGHCRHVGLSGVLNLPALQI